MLTLCGSGARLCLARALCEVACIGQINSQTVLCASMTVEILCCNNNHNPEIFGQGNWLDEVPKSLLSTTLVRAVSSFPSPRYPLALGLSYHHLPAIVEELLEGNNNVEEEVSSDSKRISCGTVCEAMKLLFKARFGKRSV